MSPNNQVNRFVKVLTVGDSCAGKTSLVRRIGSDSFTSLYVSTIGVDFETRSVNLEDGSQVKLMMFDTAGQERFGVMSEYYYRGTHVALICFDLSSRPSFEAVQRWKDQLRKSVHCENVPLILVGNKGDLKQAVEDREIYKFCRENQDMTYFATSAKNNLNIDILVKELSEVGWKYKSSLEMPVNNNVAIVEEERAPSQICCFST